MRMFEGDIYTAIRFQNEIRDGQEITILQSIWKNSMSLIEILHDANLGDRAYITIYFSISTSLNF